MQSLHKNEILLFMDFQDLLARKQKSSLNSKASKGIRIPLEVLYGHLPITPSHTALQKVRGKVVGFTGPRRETPAKKILLTSWVIKGKITSPRCPLLLAKIDDLHLK
jgi:hypothetical protein